MLEFKARTNLKLLVTNRQMEILIGCLLGDGYIYPKGKIQIEQSIKQLPYLLWKYDELSSIAYGLPKTVKRYDQRYKKTYVATRFWLRQYFRPLRNIFYIDGKKIFPYNDVSKYLTSLSLTVWYMDDGNLYGNNLKIAADGFDIESRILLQNMLFEKFGIKSSLHKSGKIRIATVSLSSFFELVKPHIHSSMIYKVS